MKLNSRLFDTIRVKPDRATEQHDGLPECAWEGCTNAGTHKAPRGRHHEGQYIALCLDHVREYNKSYNYFAGMNDDQIARFQKAATIGHRPTWKVGVNSAAQGPSAGAANRYASRDATRRMDDPFGLFSGSPRGRSRQAPEPKRTVGKVAARSFDTLGLDADADAAEIRSKYKRLVKQYHPDANGGDRRSEDRLRQIIQAYRFLKANGYC